MPERSFAARPSPAWAARFSKIATNAETILLELADKAAAVLDCSVPTRSTRHDEARPQDVRRNYSAINKARRMLGWAPRISLEDGLERSVKCFFTDVKSGQAR